MDPEITLVDAEEHMLDGCFHSAYDLLGQYWDWRFNGGFEPMDGDMRAHAIMLGIIRDRFGNCTDCERSK